MNSYEKNIQIYRENEEISQRLKPSKPFSDILYSGDCSTGGLLENIPVESHDIIPASEINSFKPKTNTNVTVLAQDTITCAKSIIEA